MQVRNQELGDLRKTRLLGSTILAAAALFANTGAYAQDSASENEEEFALEEIVVNAQRREQTILDVPVSATVFNGDQLQAFNFREADSYLLQTPNVSFQASGRNGARQIVIAIRGISDVKGGEKVNTQSAFATYFDEYSVGTLASGQANPPIYDVEAVEVLRGPQGTFFGRNSQGGAINITTRKPSEELYARIDAGFGSFNSYELSGVANVPVTDNLFTRLTIQSTTTDGPLENLHPTGGDTGADFVAVRGQMRWKPSDATTIDLSVNYIIDQQDYIPQLATCFNPTFGFNPFDPDVLGGIGCYDIDNEVSNRIASGEITGAPANFTDNRDFIYQNTPAFTDNEAGIYVGRIQHDFSDTLSIVSVTGFSESQQNQYIDLDKSGLDSVDRSGYFETEAYSQELRLSSVGAGPVDWTIGGIAYSEDFHAENAIVIKDFIGPWLRGDNANENNIDVERSGWALFGNMEWHVNDSVSLIIGARYSEDDDSNDWSNVFAACPRRAAGTPLADGCTLSAAQQLQLNAQVDADGNTFVSGGRRAQTVGTFGENSSTDFSPRIALNWNPNDDFSMYASVSKGYKPAGARANPDSGLDNVSLFGKETLWNYEIGANGYLMDRRLRLQAAVFLMNWRDLQVEVRQSFCNQDGTLIPIDEFNGPDCLITPVDRTVNAEKAQSKGAEFSMQALLTQNLQFGANIGYLDAQYKEFITSLRGTDQDLAGQRIGQAPKWTVSTNLQYDFEMAGGETTARLEWLYRSPGAVGIVQAAGSTFPQRVPSFSLVNLRLNQQWENNSLSLNIENLLNEEYYTGTDGFSWGGTLVDYNPRTYFLRWTTEFGG